MRVEFREGWLGKARSENVLTPRNRERASSAACTGNKIVVCAADDCLINNVTHTLRQAKPRSSIIPKAQHTHTHTHTHVAFCSAPQQDERESWGAGLVAWLPAEKSRSTIRTQSGLIAIPHCGGSKLCGARDARPSLARRKYYICVSLFMNG